MKQNNKNKKENENKFQLFNMQNGLFNFNNNIPKKYSYSMFAIYNDCPFRYKLIYRDKISSSKKQRYYIMMGLTLHQVLFDFFKLKNEKRNFNSMVEILNKRWKRWKIDQHKEKDCYVQCKSILYNFSNTFALNSDIFSLEYNFNIPIDSDLMTGKIDRIDRLKDGAYEIIEYKLGDKQIKKEDEIKNDLQWFIYWYAFKKIFNPMKPKRISFIFLDANKSVSFYPTRLEEKNSYNKLKNLIQIIRTDEVFEKRPSQNCNNCYFYKKECNMEDIIGRKESGNF